MANQKEKRSEKMISEQDKQAILNGAYGITRNGNKVKHIFTSDINSTQNKHLFIEYVVRDGKLDFYNTLWLSEDFKFYADTVIKHNLDVIGLWQDKPEPFDLERALAGEPVKLSNGSKAFIKYVMPKEYTGLHPLNGYLYDLDNEEEVELYQWAENGKAFATGQACVYDIVSMWKEPEPVSNTVTVTLPRPLKKPQDGMWHISEYGIFEAYYGKEMDLDLFNKRVYFDSKADAQAWFKAMQDSRR